MLIYWINIFLVMLWAIIIVLTKKKYLKIIYWFVFIQLYFLVAFRDFSVGSDTEVYVWWFETTKTVSFWDFDYSRHEKGYILFNKLLAFVNNPQVFIAITGFIPLFIIFKFIKKESKIPFLSIYLFITLGFYSDIFNLFRQIIALTFIIVSYKYLKEEKLWRFVGSILIASLFHISALAFLVIYFVKNLSPSFKSLCLYLIAAIGLYITATPLVQFIVSNFSTRSNMTVESNGGITLLLVLILTLVAGLIFRNSVVNIDETSNVLYNILYLAILVQILALEFSLFTRVTSYFMFFIIIFIPEVLSSINDKGLKYFGIILVLILTGIQYHLSLLVDNSGIVPYIFSF